MQRELSRSILAEAAYVARRGTRLYRAYDINRIDAVPILPSFLAMQPNVNARCTPGGINCPTGVTPERVPLSTMPEITAAFLNSATSQTELRQNAAGAFAGRIEQTTLNARLPPNATSPSSMREATPTITACKPAFANDSTMGCSLAWRTPSRRQSTRNRSTQCKRVPAVA